VADGGWIAVDWGTTNRRAYLLDAGGDVLDSLSDACGVLSVPAGGYPDELEALRERWGARAVVAAGMVGSDRGWIPVAYTEAPADLDGIARATRRVAADAWIVPGVALRRADRVDVMRGEEVQVLGALAGADGDDDALFCQPGTHSKWIRTVGRRIVDFSTSMTGELFALLRAHGILAGMLDGAVADGSAFRAGVDRGASAADLGAALFEVRAAVVLGTLARGDAAARASGVLIGAELGGRDLEGREVALLASGPLAELYAAAIGLRGGAVRPIDSQTAFLDGIRAVRARLA